MRNRRGSITFFMSILYLTLISFALGLIEGYRVKYLYAKQEEMGRLALQNLKADYLGDIFEEYGLLLHDEQSANSKHTLDKTFEMGFKKKIDINYFQDFWSRQDKSKEYHFPFFAADEYSYQKIKRNMSYEMLVDAKKEAILYAKDKVPFHLAGDWLEKLNMWKKGLKADEWVKKKEKLLKRLSENDRQILNLYEDLDGAVINEKTHMVTITKDGVNSFNQNMEDQNRKRKEQTERENIPEKIKQEMIDRQLCYTDLLKEVENYLQQGMDLVEEYYPRDPEMDLIEAITHDNRFRKAKQENKEAIRQEIKRLADMSRSAERAFLTAESLIAGFEESAEEMKKFLQELESAEIGISTKETMRREIEGILYQYQADSGRGRLNNYIYFKEGLKELKPILFECKQTAENLFSEAERLLGAYESTIKKEKEWDDNKQEKFSEKVETFINQQENTKNYYYFPLRYDGYSEKEPEYTKDGLEQRKANVEASGSGAEMENNMELLWEPDLNDNRLPSHTLAPTGGGGFDGGIPTINENMLDRAIEMFENMLDAAVLNEYYFMVFSHFAIQDKDDMAISGYLRSDHARKGELEYLLFGKSESANRGLMIAALFSVRILFNVVALISDPKKMAQVNVLATSIAGWWSLGAGTAILSGIIVGIWAALETGADVFMLFRGKRVPLIKTPDTWYTGLAGALQGLALEAADAAADGAEILLEKGIGLYQDAINHAIADSGTDLKNELNVQVAEQVNQLNSQIAAFDSEIKGTIGKALEAAAKGEKNAKEKAKKELLALGLTEKQVDWILSKSFGKLEQKADNLIHENYTKRVEAVEEAIKEVQEKIKEITDEVQKKGEKMIRDKIDEIGEDIIKAGKKGIQKQKELLKKKIKDKFAKKSNGSNSPKAKDWREYVGLNYVDYLRVFLILGIEENMQWLRAMDLVQQNQQQKNPDFYMTDCEREFAIRSSAKFRPVFLPFDRKGIFGKWVDGKYQVDVLVEGGY